MKQAIYNISHTKKKFPLLLYFLKRRGKISLKNQKALIFVRTRQKAERIVERLRQLKYEAKTIHGELTPAKRNDIVKEFKEGNLQILVTTDVMARGMDIPLLPYVVNYDVPANPEDYVHRVGRTARAGSTGR